MNCESVMTLLDPYMDEELDAPQIASMVEHLGLCEGCAQRYAQLLELRRGIRDHAPYFEAPAGLAEQVRCAVRRASRHQQQPWPWLALAATVLLAISLAANVVLQRSRDAGGIEENLLSSHLRALAGSHLLDVATSDQHTVKPWFNGKLAFSPEVRDLAAAGYPLAGARMDFVGTRPAAALVYRRRLHVISLFIWPSDASSAGNDFSHNGYEAVHWTRSGLSYWAVSDLNLTELRRFQKLYLE